MDSLCISRSCVDSNILSCLEVLSKSAGLSERCRLLLYDPELRDAAVWTGSGSTILMGKTQWFNGFLACTDCVRFSGDYTRSFTLP
jgi:hypothetical protein